MQRDAKTKNGRSKDVLIATVESQTLHWKNEKVNKIETKTNKEILRSSHTLANMVYCY